MIAVNDMNDKKFGVDNVIVFAKGTPLHPVVTKIIEINLEYETLIEDIRGWRQRLHRTTIKSKVVPKC